MKQLIWGLLFGAILSACATTPKTGPILTPTQTPVLQEPAEPIDAPVEGPSPVSEEPMIEPEVQVPGPETPNTVEETPAAPIENPPVSILPTQPSAEFQSLSYWDGTDLKPAFAAFKRSCRHWRKANANKALHADLPEFGKIADWLSACNGLAELNLDADQQELKRFFETEFSPIVVGAEADGLLTGYYQPEIQAQKYPTKEFREPILAIPTQKENRSKARDQLSAASARVIAFGRPAEVFFMQIQGSGILVFSDGTRLRAAYADNNGHAYTSIGRVLIDRGELTRSEASKQSIEAWMKKAGPVKARALMNENKRYIFFKEENLIPGEGPLGAMRVALTEMGSMAIDTRYYPYGIPIWVNTTLPEKKGDYNGNGTGLLLITQDTGRAIRGKQRGDIYFGTGASAGALAGVMKHPGQFTLLLPKHLAAQFKPSA